jgi:ketosteroid isomerase-like protein
MAIALALGSSGAGQAPAAASPETVIEEIKRIEQLEVEAVLAKDRARLAMLWDKDFVVNNPNNLIVVSKADQTDRPVMQVARAGFAREVERVTVRGDLAISMGNETVIPGGDRPDAGRTVRRRYTNIWMKTEGTWRLIARHANVICAD